MSWYWHLFDWVPYHNPVAMFLLGQVFGGIILALVVVLAKWRGRHARALDREDAARRVVNLKQVVNGAPLFADVSWDDMMRYVEFPALPRVGELLILDDGAYSYALRIVNHEWYIERARAAVHVHCELVERRGGP